MNRGIVNMWADALASGKYTQIRCALARADRETAEITGNCAYGVLCELAVDAGIIKRDMYIDEETDQYVIVYGTDDELMCPLRANDGIDNRMTRLQRSTHTSYTSIYSGKCMCNGQDLVLPGTVRNWLGISGQHVHIKIGDTGYREVSFLNDIRKLSFTEIASYLRSNHVRG